MKLLFTSVLSTHVKLLLNQLNNNRGKLLIELGEQTCCFSELSFTRQNSNNRIASSKKLLLSPSEASKILRTNEATVDIESKSPIKYYDVNYLGANSPPEDRQAQAKLLYSDIYLFGVFDG